MAEKLEVELVEDLGNFGMTDLKPFFYGYYTVGDVIFTISLKTTKQSIDDWIGRHIDDLHVCYDEKRLLDEVVPAMLEDTDKDSLFLEDEIHALRAAYIAALSTEGQLEQAMELRIRLLEEQIKRKGQFIQETLGGRSQKFIENKLARKFPELFELAAPKPPSPHMDQNQTLEYEIELGVYNHLLREEGFLTDDGIIIISLVKKESEKFRKIFETEAKKKPTEEEGERIMAMVDELIEDATILTKVSDARMHRKNYKKTLATLKRRLKEFRKEEKRREPVAPEDSPEDTEEPGMEGLEAPVEVQRKALMVITNAVSRMRGKK